MKKIKKILPVLLGVMVLMFGTLTVSANTGLPTTSDEYNALLSEHLHDGYSYIICVTDTDYPNKLDVYSFSREPFYKDGYAYFTDKWSYWICSYDSLTKSWHEFKSVEYNTSSMCSLILSAKKSIVYANHDLYYLGANKKIDKPFFRGPAPLVAVAEGLPEVVQNQTKVILIIAVACLALLVILLVLPKKLPRFLNR